MRRLKILEIIPTLDQSGAEKQLVLLAKGLPKERFDVRVAVLTRDGPLSEVLRGAQIPYTVIGKRAKISFRALARLKREIRAFAPDLVHTWIFAANAYGRKAAIDCGVPKIVCGERCVDPWKGRLHFAIDRYLAKKTDCFAVNSQGIRDFYVEHGLPAEKFVTIPNAVLPPKKSTITRQKIFDDLGIVPTGGAAARAQIGGTVLSATGSTAPPSEARGSEQDRTEGITYLSDRQLHGPFLIGMIARLWPQKRLEEALFSAEELKFTGCDFHLLIFGDGPQRDNLLRFRAELKLEDRVHLLGHRGDVYQFIPHLDMLWCTSAYEGQSNSILEAMACGVPVIASDIAGNRELVVPGVTGTLISEFDGDKIRRRTAFCKESFRLFLSENAAERVAMGEAGKARIEREFSLEQMISRYAALYERLIND